MKQPHCSAQYSLTRFGFLIIGVVLVFGTAVGVGFSAKVQAQDEAVPTGEAIQERLYSGPQPGEETMPFTVLHIQGGETQELEISPEDDDRTTLICFVHKLSNDDRVLYGLGLVDFYALRHEDLTSHVVLLTDERDKIIKMIQGWARGSLFPKSMISVSVDGLEGPGSYGLNRNVAMTVLVARGNKVVANLVFNAPNAQDLQSIMAALAKTLGQPEPTLAEVQQELREERQRQAEKRMRASPVFKLAPNEQLGRIMFGMVNARGNRSRNAQRLSQQFMEWAGDSDKRKSELVEYCEAVLAGDFNLNPYSRTALQKLTEE